MGIQTTCIGAYPKPHYINIANWSETDLTAAEDQNIRGFTYVSDTLEPVSDELLDRATCEAVQDQIACGIDIPTDGEQRRENYIHYHCRHMNGLDFDRLTSRVHRDGAAFADLPTMIVNIVFFLFDAL